MKRKIFVFVGAPASGKGTRIKLLEEKGYKTLSVSALLRDAGFDVGTGRLIADNKVIKLVIDAINSAEGNIILDGFPRTVPQAKALLDSHIEIDKIIYIEVSKEVVLKRCSDRLTCSNCGASYTKSEFKAPKISGICDLCGCVLIQRDDDTIERMGKRYNDFERKTIPAMHVLENAGVPVSTVDGNRAPDEILKYI